MLNGMPTRRGNRCAHITSKELEWEHQGKFRNKTWSKRCNFDYSDGVPKAVPELEALCQIYPEKIGHIQHLKQFSCPTFRTHFNGWHRLETGNVKIVRAQRATKINYSIR